MTSYRAKTSIPVALLVVTGFASALYLRSEASPGPIDPCERAFLDGEGPALSASGKEPSASAAAKETGLDKIRALFEPAQAPQAIAELDKFLESVKGDRPEISLGFTEYVSLLGDEKGFPDKRIRQVFEPTRAGTEMQQGQISHYDSQDLQEARQIYLHYDSEAPGAAKSVRIVVDGAEFIKIDEFTQLNESLVQYPPTVIPYRIHRAIKNDFAVHIAKDRVQPNWTKISLVRRMVGAENDLIRMATFIRDDATGKVVKIRLEETVVHGEHAADTIRGTAISGTAEILSVAAMP